MPWPSPATSAATAVAFGTWAALFLLPEREPMLLLLAVGFAVGGFLLSGNVILGASLVGITQATGLWLGAPTESATGLLPALVALYLVGHRTTPITGVWIVLGYVAVIVGSDFDVPRALVGILLFTATWLVGQLHAEGVSAVHARRLVAQELEDRDNAAMTDSAVARERSIILSGSLEIVEIAVRAMRTDAAQAAQSLDPVVLEQVGRRGEEAIADLRRILGLLRAPAQPDEEDRVGALRSFALESPAERKNPVWLVDALLAVALAALAVAEASFGGFGSHSLLIAAAVPLGLAVRHSSIGLATVLCALPLTLALATDTALPRALSEMATIATLGWTVGRALRPVRRRWWTGTSLLGVALLSAAGHGGSVTLGLIPVTVAVLATTSALALGSLRAAQRAMDLRIQDAQAGLQVHLDLALTAERLRIARELHDITSHAVGAMVLQARAAAALAGKDPERARGAVENALLAGDEALAELGQLAAMLNDTHLPPKSRDLTDLAERLASTGLHITIEGELPEEQEIANTVHRIVQEALTNAARHAPGSAVRVAIRSASGQLRVVVEDTGSSKNPGTTGRFVSTSGTGFGLAGLAERVRLHGGRLQAGPHRSGFRVLAEIPEDTSRPERICS